MTDTAIDWSNIGFGYMPTDYNVRCYYRDGKWGDIEVSTSDKIEMHIAATALHYGQEIFEGLKAFRGKDGKIRIFRPWENARRIRESARGILMAEIPEDKFIEMVTKVVELNERFVPPYGSGASLYIRPLEIGMSARVGVKPADEYCFMVLVTPVGPYFKGGFKPTNICIMRQYDRVAPCGTGRWKVGGNYAASLTAGEHAHELGYSAVLYLDPKEKKYLDECGPANFYAIKDGKYITPKSDSILPSITNDTLMQLARDFGMEVEQRHITVDEIPDFQEAAACGTAAVTSPVGEIDDLDTGKKYVIAKDGKPGPITTRFYDTLEAIRLGEAEDPHGWNLVLDI
jgi:branched-chain-amino-acid transaminase